MELLFTVLKYIGLGFLGLIGAFILAVIVFGKRIEKQWAVRADFKDPDGNRVGKFEVAMERIAKEESDFRLEVKCKLRHAMLRTGQPARVTVGETTAMEGEVTQDGRLRLRNDAWTGNVEAPHPGAMVTIWVDGEALISAELYSDHDSSASTIEGDAPDAVLPRTARILKKSNAKPVALALIAFGLGAGYFAWQGGATPAAWGLLALFRWPVSICFFPIPPISFISTTAASGGIRVSTGNCTPNRCRSGRYNP